jgi:hypothetical protein
MSSLRCQECGAELVAQTSFCRQCGTRISTADLSEQSDPTTKLFTDADVVATQRLDPRPTADPARLKFTSPAVPEEQKKSGSKAVLIAAVVVLLLAGLITTIAVVRTRMSRQVVSEETVIYPGARKVMDMTADGGGRALHLETSDSLDKVDAWYRNSLKPDKVIRLSPGSIVLKNDKTAATIVREGNQTNILIKMTP